MSEAQDQNANSGQQPENQQEAAEAQPNADALGQAEAILNEAGVSAEQSEQDEVGEVVTELRNDLLRLQAEYVNYRKRVERDREAVRDQAVQSVLATLLPVLDDVDAARKHGDLTDGPFAAIANKLDAVLQSHGLERIDQAGVEFDRTSTRRCCVSRLRGSTPTMWDRSCVLDTRRGSASCAPPR